MDFETLFAKTPASLDEITSRVAYALQRHPLASVDAGAVIADMDDHAAVV